MIYGQLKAFHDNFNSVKCRERPLKFYCFFISKRGAFCISNIYIGTQPVFEVSFRFVFSLPLTLQPKWNLNQYTFNPIPENSVLTCSVVYQ